MKPKHFLFLIIFMALAVLTSFGHAQAADPPKRFENVINDDPSAKHSYYYYLSLDVARTSLDNLSLFIPEWKQIAIISKLKMDGYFDLETKQDKQAYLVTHRTSQPALDLIAQGEEENGWTVNTNVAPEMPYNLDKYLVAKGQNSQQIWEHCYFLVASERPEGMNPDNAFQAKNLWDEKGFWLTRQANYSCLDFLYGAKTYDGTLVVGQWQDLARNRDLPTFTEEESDRLDRIYMRLGLEEISRDLPIRSLNEFDIRFINGVDLETGDDSLGAEIYRKDTGAVVVHFAMPKIYIASGFAPIEEAAANATLGLYTNYFATWIKSLFRVNTLPPARQTAGGIVGRVVAPVEEKITMQFSNSTHDLNALKMFHYGSEKLTLTEKKEAAEFVANGVLAPMERDPFLRQYFPDWFLKDTVDNLWISDSAMFRAYYNAHPSREFSIENSEAQFAGYFDSIFGQILMHEEYLKVNVFGHNIVHETVHKRTNYALAGKWGSHVNEGLTELTAREYTQRLTGSFYDSTAYEQEVEVMMSVRELYRRAFNLSFDQTQNDFNRGIFVDSMETIDRELSRKVYPNSPISIEGRPAQSLLHFVGQQMEVGNYETLQNTLNALIAQYPF